MALSPSVINCPILPLNEEPQKTTMIVGRPKRLVNYVAKKFTRGGTGGAATLRTEKRDGFARMSANGLPAASTSLLGTLGTQLVSVAGDQAQAFSESANFWPIPSDYLHITETLTQKPVYVANTIASIQDSARIGSATFYTWFQPIVGPAVSGIRASLIDDDGTAIFANISLSPLAKIAKVVSDGSRFWVITLNPPAIGSAFVFDSTGVEIGFQPITMGGNYFDLTFDPTQGVVVAYNDGAGNTKTSRLSFNGSAIVAVNAVVTAGAANSGPTAFLRNDRGDGFLYFVTVTGVSPNISYVGWQVNAANAVTRSYVIATGQSTTPHEIGGFVAPTGNADITVALSFLDATPIPTKNFTDVYTVTTAGASTKVFTSQSFTLVSRAFPLNGRYYAVVYFQSAFQPCYFLLSLSTGQIAGRFEYLLAYADWQTTASTTDYYHLASPSVDVGGAVHVALGHRSESFTARVAIRSGDDLIFQDQLQSTVGVFDFALGAGSGTPVVYAGEMFLPGPLADAFDGRAVGEVGILAFEQPTLQDAGAGGTMEAGTYEYTIVPEWTDGNGNRVRGRPSKPATIPIAAAHKVTVSGLSIHSTARTDIMISIYRTIVDPQSGVMTTQHYKVTTDIAPTLNDPTTATWTFTDNMSGVVAAVNERLYTDAGFLERYPAPPFSRGVTWQNRVLVIGYDGAIWMSGEKTEGDAIWFNPALRIVLPTTDAPTAIVPLDSYLLIATADNWFYVPGGNLPNPTGTEGDVPTPIALPYENGCTGVAVSGADGVTYWSSVGRPWMITRGLVNIDVGAPAVDDCTGQTCLGAAIDGQQKVGFLLANHTMVVYDPAPQCWYTWAVPGSPTTIGQFRGNFVLGCSGFVLQQTPGVYSDDGAYIPGILDIAPVHFGGVRGFGAVWECQIVLDVASGGCTITATETADDDIGTPIATYTGALTSGAPRIVSLKPRKIRRSSMGVTITDTNPTPNAGISVEMLVFKFGVSGGVQPVGAANRIRGT